MRKRTINHVVCLASALALLCPQPGRAVIEEFETETEGAKTFSEGGLSFSLDDDLLIEFFDELGSVPPGGGTVNSDFWLGSGFDGTGTPGDVGSITVTTPGMGFIVNAMDTWVSSNDGGQFSIGEVTFTGTPAAGGAPIAVTVVVTPTGNTSGDVYDTTIFAGTLLQGVVLSSLKITVGDVTGTSPNAPPQESVGAVGDPLNYFALDNLDFTPAAVAAPEIDVQRPAATSIADGGSDALGNVDLAGSNVTYTIDNSGAGDLTIPAGGVIFAGQSNVAASVVTTLPLTVTAGTSSSLVINVDPTAAGAFSFNMDIASNDADEDPYDIAVSGTGLVVPPAVPTGLDLVAGDDSGALSDDDITNETMPEITGSGEDGSTVTLTSSIAGSVGTTLVSGGSWSITPISALADGVHQFTATAAKNGATSGPSAALQVTIDTVAPTLNGIPGKNLVVNAPAGMASIPVSYGPVTATDLNPVMPVVTCSPAPNSMFPVGSTSVSCSATDTAGNTNAGGFDVIVLEIAITPGTRLLDAVGLRGDTPAGAPASLNNITRAFLNNSGGVVFSSSLDGGGTGLFSGSISGGLATVAIEGAPAGAGTFGSFSELLLNDSGHTGFRSQIGSAQTHFVDAGGGIVAAAVKGAVATPAGGGEEYRSFQKPALASNGELLTRANLVIGSGTPTVNSGNDTLITSSAGTLIAREGSATGLAGIDYSGIHSRLVASVANERYAFTAFLKPSSSLLNTALFAGVLGGGDPAAIVREGDPAAGTGGGVFNSFLAESVNSAGEVVLRGTARGAGITTSDNECIWTTSGNAGGSPVLVAREGEITPCLPPGIAGLVAFDRFTTIAIGDDGSVCFFAYLKNSTAAPAVTSDSDGSLWRWTPAGGLHLIAREGDLANNTDGAVISRLTGFACSGAGGIVYQVEFVAGQGDTTSANRDGIYLDRGIADAVAELIMRRGDSFDLMGVNRTVGGLKISTEENSGGGTGGYGRAINDSGAVLLNLSLSGNLSGIFVLTL